MDRLNWPWLSYLAVALAGVLYVVLGLNRVIPPTRTAEGAFALLVVGGIGAIV